MTRLFTTSYPEQNSARRAEYQECMQRNLACAEIDQICVLVEGEGPGLPPAPKLQVRRILKRPCYVDYFAWINELALPQDYSVIANTDVWFDGGLRQIEAVDWEGRKVLAITRWDVLDDGAVRLFEHGDSQDCWILRGGVENVRGDFPMGVYDCDNKIAWEFEQAGYRVVNPALSLRTYHLHLCGYRSYRVTPAPDYGIRPPFRYIEPDNLWGLWQAWRLERHLGLPYLPWQMTSKKFWRYPLPRLAQRAWNKARRMLGQ